MFKWPHTNVLTHLNNKLGCLSIRYFKTYPGLTLEGKTGAYRCTPFGWGQDALAKNNLGQRTNTLAYYTKKLNYNC